MDMEKKIRNFLEQYQMIRPGDTVLLGLSGGADSVLLFLILEQLQQELLFTLQAIHVNHHLRGEEAERDAHFAEELCRAFHVPFFLSSCEVKKLAQKEHLTLEEAGRKARQDAFLLCMQEHGADKLALAHHQNDVAETMVHHLARGTSLSGLAALRPVRGFVIRPLLCVSHAEIEEELKKRNVSWCEDSSNSRDEFTRNGIRHHVIEYLTKEVNGQTPLHMTEASLDLLEVEEFLEEEAGRRYEIHVQKQGEDRILLDSVREEPKAVCRFLIRKCLMEVCGQKKDLTREHIESVRTLLEKQAGKEVSLPYGVRAVREYGSVRLTGKKPGAEQSRQEIPLPGEGTVSFGDYTVTVTREPVISERMEENKYTKWVDCDIITDSLVLRTRKSGDFLTVTKEGGRKKLKDYLIDEKIPRERRDQIPLLAAGSEILWVIGYRRSESYRVGKNTRSSLKIQIRGGNNTNEGDDSGTVKRGGSGPENP